MSRCGIYLGRVYDSANGKYRNQFCRKCPNVSQTECSAHTNLKQRELPLSVNAKGKMMFESADKPRAQLSGDLLDYFGNLVTVLLRFQVDYPEQMNTKLDLRSEFLTINILLAELLSCLANLVAAGVVLPNLQLLGDTLPSVIMWQYQLSVGDPLITSYVDFLKKWRDELYVYAGKRSGVRDDRPGPLEAEVRSLLNLLPSPIAFLNLQPLLTTQYKYVLDPVLKQYLTMNR